MSNSFHGRLAGSLSAVARIETPLTIRWVSVCSTEPLNLP
jgi:hypothetical protein